MHLLHTRTRRLENFQGHDIPPYAILSHTWDREELTFQDLKSYTARWKPGYAKVRRTCEIAVEHGFEYIWIDTCCIEKESSAALSEAINSMYRWYQEAAVCFAYLADVRLGTVAPDSLFANRSFFKSRWFTRGWTLQELIAPETVIFLDGEWQEIGTKATLKELLSSTTGIPTNILLDGGDLRTISVAQRMSWASKRQTTRLEDRAYSLMGIFGVNMPLLYGEGDGAFIRLQEVILKITDDYSIFAWRSTDLDSAGLLARSPDAFRGCHKFVSYGLATSPDDAMSITTRGISLPLRFVETKGSDFLQAVLPCRHSELQLHVAIHVQALSQAKNYFRRVRGEELPLIDLEQHRASARRRVWIQHQYQLPKRASPLLSRAAASMNVQMVKWLLDHGVNADSGFHNGYSPIANAVLSRNEETVALLIAHGAQLNLPTPHGYSPLHIAVANGHEAMVARLLKAGAYMTHTDSRLIIKAAQDGHEGIVKLLLEHGADPDHQDYHPETRPLNVALARGHLGVARLLLQKGADWEFQDRHGLTMLGRAALRGYDNIARPLLEADANLEHTDSHGCTPLLLAAREGHAHVVKLFLDKGARYEVTDRTGRTPLTWAAFYGRTSVVELLLKHGASLDAEDGDGETALRWTAYNDHEGAARALIEHGADFEAQNRLGQTPLILAALKGHAAVVRLLLDCGADVEARDTRECFTPLMWALCRGTWPVVQMLLEHGADPTAEDEDGSTVLSLARERNLQRHAPKTMRLLESSLAGSTK
jgi:ankyrin repeat protein